MSRSINTQLQTLVTIVTFFACSGLTNFAIADDNKEFKVETAFIFQFTNYISWPNQAKLNPGEFFVISVVGDSPIFEELEQLAGTKKIKGQAIAVLRVKDPAQLKKSNVVVVMNDDISTLQTVSKRLKGANTLVVSHSEGFAERGSMINFFEEDGRLRFEINRAAILDQKLEVSSQLLKLARLVESR